MIFSGSGSSYEIFEFWIRIQPISFEHICKLLRKKLKFNQKEDSTNCLPFSISYYSPKVYTQSRNSEIPEIPEIWNMFSIQ